MRYINRKRFKKKCIQGEVNFPYKTKFECNEKGLICHNGKPVCYNTSQDGFDYFSRDDDGQGVLRGRLIEQILEITRCKDEEKKRRVWETINNNSWIEEKFRNKEHQQVWLWNFEFYNAEILDLENILYKIKDV